MVMPQAQDLGGTTPGVPPFVRAPYYPTAPFYSTAQNVGYQTRFYSTGIVFNTDYTVANAEVITRVQFDLPCRLISWNAACTTTDNFVTVQEQGYQNNGLNLFLIRFEYSTGDQITVQARLASTVCGSGKAPGELGGTGYTINTGGSLIVGITPLFTNCRIDVTLVCLEMRGPSNFTRG